MAKSGQPKKKKKAAPTIHIDGDVVDANVIAGDNNTVNQTIIQKFFNIFKSDAETVDQRNRRIMLGHVENFWVKGILEKSLHGAALLDLGIKEDPDALNYPWAIKREATKETLPANKSMLEIFQEIGMGRSLLILGAPGSGKTTMLLELTRQLIKRARQDVTEPIPVVFNLSSWTEKLTLANWLARQLNIIYSVPRKIAPIWVKENKMLLLLDGLDEVRQESRDKCVDAINQFRKENGLTSMAVCSRIQDYAELKTKLSFDGAIEIQPLISTQIDEYFKHFGKGLAGIRYVLEKDTVLREMAETPLFLSIMTLAYRDLKSVDILVSEDLDIQRKQLFDTYVERMFERSERSKNGMFKRQNVLGWLSWLARKMIIHSQSSYVIEQMQQDWLNNEEHFLTYKIICSAAVVQVFLIMSMIVRAQTNSASWVEMAFITGFLFFGWLTIGSNYRFMIRRVIQESGFEIDINDGAIIHTVDIINWDWKRALVAFGLGSVSIVVIPLSNLFSNSQTNIIAGLIIPVILGLAFGFNVNKMEQSTRPGQRLSLTIQNFLFVFAFVGIITAICYALIGQSVIGFAPINTSVLVGLLIGLFYGGFTIIQHYTLRLVMAMTKLLPWRLIPFLDYCVDRIFLRRVGGGYIFVHRLLMEHFAAMYSEEKK